MVNSTVEFVLWKTGINAAGELPIYLKVTISRETRYLASSHFTLPKYWSDKNQGLKEGHNLWENINSELKLRKNEVNQKILELSVAGKPVSAKIIKDYFSGKNLNNIFNFIDAYCIEVKHKRKDSSINLQKDHMKKLLAFNRSRNLNFEDITPAYLQRFEQHLRDAGAKNNYVHTIWTTLKMFFNAGKKRKIISCFPFDEYENPVYETVVKDRLTQAELDLWENYTDKITNPTTKQAAVYFLLGCYSGLRVSDWKAFNADKHVQKGYMTITATKNNEFLSVPLSAPLARAIERVKNLPRSVVSLNINRVLKVLSKEIGIKKRLSTHTGRHTFAITVCAENGISCAVCAKLMGITTQTCEKHYYRTTLQTVHAETSRAWGNLK